METDLKNVVKGVSLATRKSKAGNDYQVLAISFTNGYKIENFISQDQLYIVNDILSRFGTKA